MKYPWKETSLGKVGRHLDNSEKLLTVAAVQSKSMGREHWALNIILDVSFASDDKQVIVKALRDAWLKLRYYHPFVATYLHVDEDRYEYTTPNEDELQKWLSESFFVHEDNTVNRFILEAGWSEYSSLNYFPKSSQIIMRTHHWLTGGIGGLHLANRFFELCAAGGPAPQFGDEAKFLPPCLLDAAGFTESKEPEAQQQALAKFMEFAGNLPSIGVPIQSSPTGPGGTKTKRISFPKEKLQALLKACKAKGITVACAVHAAVAVALQERAYNADAAKTFTTLGLFDYRRYLPEPYSDVRRFPLGVWMLGLSFSLPLGDFDSYAQACKKVYTQPVARDVFPMVDTYEQYTGMMVDSLSRPPPPGMVPLSIPQFSSFGLIDGRIQQTYAGENEVTVSKVEPVVDLMLPAPVVFQWSFAGTFYINVCYNENFSTDEFMEGFLERIGSALMEGMGIAQDTHNGGDVL